MRVAGYSDYFCDLSPALQDEIIARTEHEGFGEASPAVGEGAKTVAAAPGPQ